MKQHPLQNRQKSAIAKQRSPPKKQGKYGRAGGENYLTLKLPTTTIVAQPFNVIKWQLKFNPVA